MMDVSAVGRILEDYRARGYYPSAVCQVFDETHTLYRGAFGDVTEDTWFDLASVSKIICTTMRAALRRRTGCSTAFPPDFRGQSH